MRIISLLLTTILLIAVGCDQESSRQTQGQEQFEEVLTALREVELGFVTASEEEVAAGAKGEELQTHREPMGTFRQKQLVKTFELLQPILTNGTADQKVDAQRIAADIYTSSARYQMRELVDQWTALSERSVVMMSYMVAVGRSQSLAQNSLIDDEKLISQIKKTLRDTTVQLDKREKDATLVDAKAKEHQKTMAGLKTQIDELNKQAQDLKAKAFVATGKAKYKLLDDSSAVARQAAILDARRQVEQAQLANVNAQRLMLTEQIDFTLEFMDSLERQIEEATKREKNNSEQQLRYKQHLVDTENQFMDEFNDIAERFSNSVYPYFAKINGEMDQAMTMLANAHKTATGDRQQMLEIEILAKQVAALNMKTTMSMIMQDVGNKYQSVLTRATNGRHKIMADRRATFESAYQDLQRKQMVINQESQALLETARQQAMTAVNLVAENGQLTRLANNHRSTDMEKLSQATQDLNSMLDIYAKRITDFRLN
ncbi:MAG TPA: hypothetical protein DCM28_23350 [Phycisphaerales bacterium]|nr:hypothetical protein [Phycisphaerales bacterium]HCD30918.1 hypothetical protein [Phycisphaerales bacterium]